MTKAAFDTVEVDLRPILNRRHARNMLKIPIQLLNLGQLIRQVLLVLLDRLQVLLLIFFYYCLFVNLPKRLLMLQLLPNKHLAVWLLRCDAFQEFFLVEATIIIQIQSSNYCCSIFNLYAFGPISFEESVEGLDVDVGNITWIHRRIHGIDIPVIHGLQPLLFLLCLNVHFQLFHEEAGQVLFYVNRQIIVRFAVLDDALGRGGAELVVDARQDNLQILRIAQFSVLISIEKFHEIVAISFARTRESIFSQEI